MDFLQQCVKMLLDEANMREMIQESATKNIGLDRVAVEFQRDVLEYNFRIERNFGCKYLSIIGQQLFTHQLDYFLTSEYYI